MVEEVKKWWGDWQEETQWLEGAESKMADLRPLAGGVPLIKTQKEENEVCIYMQYLCVFVNRSTYMITSALPIYVYCTYMITSALPIVLSGTV